MGHHPPGWGPEESLGLKGLCQGSVDREWSPVELDPHCLEVRRPFSANCGAADLARKKGGLMAMYLTPKVLDGVKAEAN